MDHNEECDHIRRAALALDPSLPVPHTEGEIWTREQFESRMHRPGRYPIVHTITIGVDDDGSPITLDHCTMGDVK